MVGIVIVSHSEKVAQGVMELCKQMAPDVAIAAAGGLPDGEIGTDFQRIYEAVEAVRSDDGPREVHPARRKETPVCWCCRSCSPV